jgi:hypothetical protein
MPHKPTHVQIKKNGSSGKVLNLTKNTIQKANE